MTKEASSRFSFNDERFCSYVYTYINLSNVLQFESYMYIGAVRTGSLYTAVSATRPSKLYIQYIPNK